MEVPFATWKWPCPLKDEIPGLLHRLVYFLFIHTVSHLSSFLLLVSSSPPLRQVLGWVSAISRSLSPGFCTPSCVWTSVTSGTLDCSGSPVHKPQQRIRKPIFSIRNASRSSKLHFSKRPLQLSSHTNRNAGRHVNDLEILVCGSCNIF